MTETEWLAERFEEHRAISKQWRTGCLAPSSRHRTPSKRRGCAWPAPTPPMSENLGAWVTTVVSRVCLTMLRSRRTRREDPLSVHVPDPIVTSEDALDPEQQTMLADSVGLARLVVLETLSPDERLEFVLHVMFAVPFEEIAPMVGGPRRPPASSPAGPAAADF